MPKYTVTKNMGAALKNLRQQRRVKAIDLAKSIGKTGAYISKLEKGELNTIDCDDFITIIRKMSNSEKEFSEAIDVLLKDTSMEYTEEDKKKEEWQLNLDYFYRALPIKEEYQNLVKSKMDELHITASELSTYINQNVDIYNSDACKHLNLDELPRNKWVVLDNGDSFVLMDISSDTIRGILTAEKGNTSYAKLFCILMSLYRLEKKSKDEAYSQATKDLADMDILTIQDTENIMREYGEQKKIRDLLSQRDNENLPAENRKLLTELNNFVQSIHSFAIVNIAYTSEKMVALNKSFKDDPVITLKLLGTDLSALKDKPTIIKKEFFDALDDLIQEYSLKDAKPQIELL